MKKNLVLTGILVFLIAVAFVTEEIFKPQARKEQTATTLFFQTIENVSQLQNEKMTLLKTNQGWQVKDVDWPVDQKLVGQSLNVFSKIYISEKIETEKSDVYFSNFSQSLDFRIKGKNRTLILGNVSEVTGAFYLRWEDQPRQVYICYDKTVTDMIYSNQVQLNIQKYLRLQKIFKADRAFFLANNFFKILQLGQAKSIYIDNKHNRWFSLDLVEQKITPPGPKAIRELSLIKQITNGFSSLAIKRVIDSGKNILSNPRSKIVITYQNESQSQKHLRIYSGLNKKFGYYLKLKDKDLILELESGNKSIFFMNRQDFWDKRIDYGVNFSEIKTIRFKLGYNAKKLYPFVIKGLENFEVTSSHKKVNFISKPRMNFLFNLILNLTEFRQAYYVDENLKNKPKDFDLFVVLFGKKLQIKIKNRAIIVYDPAEKLLFRYRYNTKQIKPGFFKKIFTVKPK